MALFPQNFIDDLKQHADIVLVIQDYVTLKKLGANYKGLCPFHGEKTPSFQVDRERRFFHCFGCGVSGDVIKFLELHQKIGFVDAVKQLAQRFGLALPEMEQTEEQKAGVVERESLLKVHEAAAAWFAAQLASGGGLRIRRQIAARGITDATSAALGLGYAPQTRDGLKAALLAQGYSPALLLRAGLVVQRDDGSVVDRFRNRLMIPICRESGSVIAFGGRAVDGDQQPKYLNSPETPIYSKSRTLYGLNLAKAAIRQGKVAVLVEGYFDFAQVYQAGFQSVVASCGTALTTQQAQLLKRFTTNVVLSFDPDTAGQGASVKSCELLVQEGFRVSVATLPAGEDPDTFVRHQGGAGYRQQLAHAKPYLEYLLDRAAAGRDLNSDEGRLQFLTDMMPVAARIPDAPTRDRFADRLAHRARVTEEVVRAEIRKAAVQKHALPRAQAPSVARVSKAEKALIWWLINRSHDGLRALEGLSEADLAGLPSRSVLDLAAKLNEDRGFSPSVLLERLGMMEAQLVTTIASEPEPPALGLSSCVREMQRSRYAQERAELQREIDHLQSSGAGDSQEMNALLTRKLALGRRIQALVSSED
jgi:DNA primase